MGKTTRHIFTRIQEYQLSIHTRRKICNLSTSLRHDMKLILKIDRNDYKTIIVRELIETENRLSVDFLVYLVLTVVECHVSTVIFIFNNIFKMPFRFQRFRFFLNIKKVTKKGAY